MNIALLNSSFISTSPDPFQRLTPHIRVGVAVMAAYLRQAGHSVRIFDAQTVRASPDRFIADIVRAKPDIVGFSAFTEEINEAAVIAEKIRPLSK